MRGVVVCPQPRAADVGAEVLSAGGNAFDAAIATAFAQMIADPFMCGIGGMGTLQYFAAASGEHGMIDFHTRAGSRVTPDMWANDMRGRAEISKYTQFEDFRSELGYTAIMTPGTVAGFWETHARLGTRPWAELLQPAIRMARDGLEITPFVREFWARRAVPGAPSGLQRLKTTAECARLFLDGNGDLLEVGALHRNPDYGHTLALIAAHGPDSFYRGALAHRIVADFEAHGAFITADDLAGYEVRSGEPVFGRYRGLTVASNPPPGSGPTLIEMLQILEHFDLSRLHHNSAEHLDLVARAMAAAHADREAWLGDPDYVDARVPDMVSPERAAHWAARIRNGEFLASRREEPQSCTTHFCVYDEAGNAVSCTHTLGTGAGVVTPGLGFVWNNSMKLFDPVPGRANSMAPGKARTTAMSPTMLLKDGRPWLLVGAPGGSVIISAILQTILNVVDFGMSPVAAVAMPRIHCEGGPVHVEARVEGAVVEALRRKGHIVKQTPISYDPVMSRAHAVLIDGGEWTGGADPRGGGGVAYSR